MSNDDRSFIRKTLADLDELITEAKRLLAHPVGVFVAQAYPRRGDDVEAWLKKWRDVHPTFSKTWDALDDVLDDYRLHADVAQPLFVEVSEHGSGTTREDGAASR